MHKKISVIHLNILVCDWHTPQVSAEYTEKQSMERFTQETSNSTLKDKLYES